MTERTQSPSRGLGAVG